MSSLVFHFMIIFLTIEFPNCYGGRNSSIGCVPMEKKALLKFKASLSDPSNRLSSWDDNHKDCCAWDGVMCDESTGHVIGLDLKNRNGEYGSNTSLQGNQLDSSLLELEHLSYLDLSWNYFELSPIPAFIGSMKQLQHLNLSGASFDGAVPQSLGNLSSLELLDLSNIDLSRTKNLIEVLGILPSLSKLRLSGSGLNNTHLPHTCQNSTLFTHIQHLDLSRNWFEGELPCFLQNMTSLRVLDLSHNNFNSSENLHPLRARNLVYLDLSSNSFHQKVDWIFELIQDKCHMKSLNLNENLLYGNITELFKNLSAGCWIDKLETLSLGTNNFYGNLPEELGELNQLKYLDLSSNNLIGKIPTSLGQLSNLEYILIYNNTLSGSIPSWLGNLSSLTELDLGSNQLSGEVPTSLGQLSNLEYIDISSNSFSGSLFEAHFANLSRLESFWAGYNLLKFKVRLDWVPPFQLSDLDLHSIYIGGQFPQWLQTQKRLTQLDMSNCSISGTLPDWLQYLNLRVLYLSDNHIAGSIPKLASSMIFLDLSNNTINHLPRDIGHMKPCLLVFSLAKNSVNGSIPNSLCEMKELNVIDLSNNYLSGHLPDCWKNFPYLSVMRLSSNELSGIIPNSLGAARSLEWLHLNNNSLTGQFPSSLKNCTDLVLVDIGDNKLTGTLPDWDENYLPHLKFLGLRGNEFYGIIPSSFCQMSQLRVIDLANNKLTGQIPHCFGDFLGMMNESHIISSITTETVWGYETMGQVIKGAELDFTSTLDYLVNLDLSNNNLSGEVST